MRTPLRLGMLAIIAAFPVLLWHGVTSHRAAVPLRRASGPAANARVSRASPPQASAETQANAHAEPAPVAAPAAWKVTGTVLGPDDKPCRANVIARGLDDPFGHVFTTTSGADGAFTIDLPRGDWSLYAESKDALSESESLDGWWHKDESCVSLDPLRLMVKGTACGFVYDADGRRCPGARVMVLSPSGGTFNFEYEVPAACVRADSDGHYEIASRPGQITLQAEASGESPAYSGATIEAGHSVDIDLHLARAAEVHGRVVNTGGQPLPDIAVTVYFGTYNRVHPFPSTRTTRTDAEGSYHMGELGPTCYGVYAEREGYLRATGWFWGDDPKPVDLVLVRAGAIEGRILPGGGTLPADTKVALRWAEVPRRRFGESRRGDGVEADVGKEGTFHLDAVPPGRYFVQAKAKETAIAESEEVEVSEGAVVQGVEVTLRQGGAFRGTVREASSGKPIARAQVDEFDEGTGVGLSQSLVRSDSSGRFEVPELSPGRHSFRVHEENHASLEVTVQVPDGGVVERSVPLPDGARVRGQVLLDGAPPLNVYVFACTLDGPRTVPVYPSRAGLYEWTAACEGEWWVGVLVSRGKGLTASRAARRVRISGAAPIDGVDFSLRSSPHVSGTVRQGGAPLVRWTVYLLGVGGRDGELYSSNTDEDGNFAFVGVERGDYLVLRGSTALDFPAPSSDRRGFDTAGAPGLHIDGAADQPGLNIDLPAATTGR